jgi:hypothetical protein
MRSAVHPHTHPSSHPEPGVWRHPDLFALAYAVAWSLWILLAILRDRVPSPLGFVLLVVPPAHLIGTAMGCRTVPVAIPIRALRKPRAYGSACGQGLTSSADDELGLDLGRPLGMLITSGSGSCGADLRDLRRTRPWPAELDGRPLESAPR